MNLNMPKVYYLLIAGLLLFNNAFAMPDDKDKVIEVAADTASLSQQKHQGHYNGDVELNQGTTHIRASKAITKGNEQNKLVVAIALGDPTNQAHYWTQTALDKPLLHAYADTIKYHPDKHLIELIGHARVMQGDNSFSAAKITYDMLKQHVVSTGDKENRTLIIIHPEKKDGKKA